MPHAISPILPRALRALALALTLAAVACLALPGSPSASGQHLKCGGKRATIVGTPGNDTIRAPKWGRQVIVGLGGNDVIFARNGKDTVCGGPGDDRIDGGVGPDRLFGGPGNDRIYGGRGADLISGDEGDDVLVGGPGKERLRGGSGHDVIRGGLGPDRISGGSGNDRIHGGSNRDRIHGDDGDDFIDGGPGGDRLWGDGGDDLIRGRDGGDMIYGGDGDDRVYGDLVDDWLWGGPGDDVIIGGHGIDIMHGDSGDDLLRGGTNRNGYDGGPGHDTASFATATPGGWAAPTFGVIVNLRTGRATADGAESLKSIEKVLGSNFGDELRGMAGTSVDGGEGDDKCDGFSSMVNCRGTQPKQHLTLDLRDPRDPGLVLVGGPGPDRWKVAGVPGGVTVQHQTPLSFDEALCSRLDSSTIGCSVAPRFVLGWGSDGADSIEIGGGLPPGVTVDIDGGPGENLLIGGTDDDVLIDRGGRTTMIGRGGSDAMISGPGRDVLRGDSGNDQMVTSTPCDGHVFIGGKGNLDIAGFARAPFPVRAARGGVARRKGPGACSPTRIHMSSEVLEGTSFGDILIGTKKADSLIGGRGNDRLVGRGGRDHFNGGPGRDRCIGGRAVVQWNSCRIRRLKFR